MCIPDIGDFADVPVIEVHVAPGDVVAAEDPVLTLESDKATMDIPAPAAGTVEEVLVQVGSRVATGDLVLRLATTGAGAPSPTHPVTHEDAVPAPVDRPGYGSAAGVYDRVEVTVPDLGDFTDVPVTEVLVGPGDRVGPHDPVVTLESDKAVMEIPASQPGTVEEVAVRVGDRVRAGSILLFLRTEDAAAVAPPRSGATAGTPAPAPATASRPGDVRADVLVLGAGPGGYTAAFRAADLGKAVVLVDRWPALGGVCLNVGCIPSKALLHAAKVIAETREMAEHGLSFGEPSVDVDALRRWKDTVVGRLTGGLTGLARQRKVTVVRGSGRFTSPNQVQVELADGGTTTVDFEQAIIAAGSEPVRLPFIPHDDPRVMDSTGALELVDVPQRLLVLGGGIIGLEMATVYHQLGAEVTVVELMDQIIPGADRDLVQPLHQQISKAYAGVHLKTKVTAVEARPEGLVATLEGDTSTTATFDRMLVAVGRRPNGPAVGAEEAGVVVDERGFVPVDKQMRTNVPHVFAIGDVVGQPMLAHKATHEGKVAAEVTAGQNSYFDARVIPSVAYTDPEVAWVGVTENEARAAGIAYGKGVFPWAASGRALSIGRDEGFTKLLFDEASHRVIGAGVVGPSAGELIAELGLAIEMGADAADIGLTIHAHPTLSETVGMAAEAFEGTLTDLYLPKRR
ncbi:dihydrolipoyl dehydrogenase [Geodermatophilus bullaregiensis]|uniref:dihydrolipoyl dehydrogenase n=1 Tax=Geodermatophilus bullaregiensis TaxID=1564160 RepID=UPI0035574D0C